MASTTHNPQPTTLNPQRSGPKGAFDIGLQSARSLFELFAHRLIRLQQLAISAAIEQGSPERFPAGGPVIRWLVMTSPGNDAATKQFFAAHKHFGLRASQIAFFVQTTLPAFSATGRWREGSGLSTGTA